ncbi:hypothetical protein AB0G48_18070 [Streptomyces rubiginosohelvolus]|uniref:hypothetical protein n=1 Tax=Streptomyces rubiginosohelvolus TaxID=67362 RepID=UPI0033FFC062
MVPQLVAVADAYGVPVGSCSGFNALPAKRGAALRAAADGHRAVRVFVVSDWDPSAVHLFSALAEDVTAFAAVDAPGTEVVFERLAVTEQQIADYQLPTAPQKALVQRHFHHPGRGPAARRPRRRAQDCEHRPLGNARPGGSP